ncbi:MAG: B12-binding domain-containing radical SAM protein [Clostridium sp.]|nr:B12-binding domain-containing radical SAM protein [Clostridium sp.]
MKYTFIIPPVSDESKRPAERSAGCTRVVYPIPNIYELIVAAVLHRCGRDVALEDFTTPTQRSYDNFIEWLKNDDSDIYCIWGVNLSIIDDVKAIECILDTKHSSKILLMGPAPTFFSKSYPVDPRIYIARGEPEKTVEEWDSAITTGDAFDKIDGLTWHKDGKTIHNRPRKLNRSFDDLPFPFRELLKTDYHNPKIKLGPYTTVLTSRNCPYQCIYCVPSSLTFARELEAKAASNHKPIISYRSIESINDELKMLHSQGYRALGFVDDNFIWNEERTFSICELLKKYGFVWGCQARVDAITEPIAKALGESGCAYVDLGIESFDDEILKYIKKGISSKDIYRAIKLLQKYKVPVKLNVLIGTCPLETKETIKNTVSQAKKLKVDQLMVNIVSPFPGTELYDLAIKNGWIVGGEYKPTDVQKESILNYPKLTAKQMERALFKANLEFFISPNFILKQLKRFNSLSEFKVALKALWIKLFG